MADVTTTFGAKDVGVAATIQRLQGRLAAFQASMTKVSAVANKMSAGLSGLGRSVIGLAAAYVGVTQAISAFNNALEIGGKLNDLSAATGETAGSLAVLQRAFDNAGVGGDRVGPMLSRMAQFVGDLGTGSGKAADIARELGISLNDLKGKTPTEQMATLLRALAGVTDETKRLDLAGDIFGNRIGAKLIPLATNFNGEIDTARGQLGSLVKILDENAQSLDELGDAIKNGVGNKLTELAVGFLAGVKGANELADAMSKIDAAGAGLELGKMFSGAMKVPEQAFVAMGEVLLLGVMKAANYLLNSINYAAEVYSKALTNSSLWLAVADGLASAFGLAINFLTRSLASAVKTAVLEPLASLPSVLGGGIYKSLLNSFEDIQRGLDAEAASYKQEFGRSLTKAGQVVIEESRKTPKQTQDIVGVEAQSKEVAAALARLKAIAEESSVAAPKKTQAAQQTQRQTDATQAEEQTTRKLNQARELLNKQYDRSLQSIEHQKLSSEQYVAAIDKLNQWMNAQMSALTTPQKQLQEASASESARKEIIAEQTSRRQEDESTKDLATETTLQKVASLLDSLNTKLPQPVLT